MPDVQFLAEQVGELFESGVLVVDRENDQAATVVVTVHDLLILHSGRPRAGDLRSGSADYGDCETA